jgi:hypothetical protein
MGQEQTNIIIFLLSVFAIGCFTVSAYHWDDDDGSILKALITGLSVVAVWGLILRACAGLFS